VQLELLAARQRDRGCRHLAVVEHPHVLTLGRGCASGNLLASADMPVFEVERGGGRDLHTGQATLRLPHPVPARGRAGRNTSICAALRRAVIRTLAEFAIGDRQPG